MLIIGELGCDSKRDLVGTPKPTRQLTALSLSLQGCPTLRGYGPHPLTVLCICFGTSVFLPLYKGETVSYQTMLLSRYTISTGWDNRLAGV